MPTRKRKRSKNYGLGCPRCGGSTTRESMIITCRKCGWRQGDQQLSPWYGPSKLTPTEELPITHTRAFPGKRRTPLDFK